MNRITVLVDDEKLRRVRRILGTRGIRDTVDRALDEVIVIHARRRALEQLRTLDLELGDEAVMRDAWR